MTPCLTAERAEIAEILIVCLPIFVLCALGVLCGEKTLPQSPLRSQRCCLLFSLFVLCGEKNITACPGGLDLPGSQDLGHGAVGLGGW